MTTTDQTTDRKRIEEHKVNMRRLGRYAHQYLIGWTKGELSSSYRPSYQLHSIRLVLTAYLELEEEAANAR